MSYDTIIFSFLFTIFGSEKKMCMQLYVCVYSITHPQKKKKKNVHFRLSILDCIWFGAGGYCIFGTIWRFIDDYIGCLHSTQVCEIRYEFQWKSISKNKVRFCCVARFRYTLHGWNISHGWCMQTKQWRLFNGKAYKI